MTRASQGVSILVNAFRNVRPRISFGPGERLVIYTNNNLTRGKASAAAVHAALMHYGIDHGAVIVLGMSPGRIDAECDLVVRDAGLTEVDPGTITAGVVRPASDTNGGSGSP